MALKIDNALKAFDLADFVDLNCGTFDLRIRQAAVHNENFRAAIAKRTMAARRKSIAPDRGTLTGNFEQDVELFCELIVLGWGERPLVDDEGAELEWTRELGYEMFTSTKRGRVLFGKVMGAAASDEMFAITEGDLKNS